SRVRDVYSSGTRQRLPPIDVSLNLRTPVPRHTTTTRTVPRSPVAMWCQIGVGASSMPAGYPRRLKNNQKISNATTTLVGTYNREISAIRGMFEVRTWVEK